MKHYVLLLRESKIGWNCYIDTHFIKNGNAPDDIPTLSKFPKTLDEATEWLVANNYTNAGESFATLKDSDESIKYANRTGGGMIRIHESSQLFPLTLVEFVLNNCGALTVFYFNMNGEGTRRLTYRLHSAT
jgi:hypothetical protein